MASGLRARAIEARAIQVRWREGKSKRRVTSKDSLFHHHHHPNFYDFFPRAIAPFTGNDMASIMWDSGLKGTVWRILKNMNTNLKAQVKTRNVEMEVGGKQGSRLSGRQFEKMMDTLAETFHNTEKGCALAPSLQILTLSQ